MSADTQFFFQEDQEGFISLLDQANYGKVFLLADANTNGFCLPVLKQIFPFLQNSHLIVIPAGESNKNIDVCQIIWGTLLKHRADKRSVLINAGGGMVSDIGGFAATTFKRGIDFVNIPTTLLAMVDASNGGKNGIDFNDTKNAIGSFSSPKAVYVNPVFLQTLSDVVLRSGIAEIVKHSLLADENYFNEIADFEISDFFSETVIKKSIEFKSEIVQHDPNDEGIRQTLNFGHSIGHALESHTMHMARPLLHGEAVMLGLIYELMLSHFIYKLPLEIIDQVIQFKNRIFADLYCPFELDDIEQFLWNDKKNVNQVRMSLLENLGNCRWQVPVSIQQIRSAIFDTQLLLSNSK